MIKPVRFRTRVGCYGLIYDGSKVLLCQLSSTEPDGGLWTLPGGGMEFGESPEQTVVREVREETGYLVRPGALHAAFAVAIPKGNFNFQSVQIVYNAEIISGELCHELDGSTQRGEWFDIEMALKIPSVPLVQRTIQSLLEA